MTGGYPEAGVQWYEVDPASNLGGSILARKGVIGSAGDRPGLAHRGDRRQRTLFVTYNRASAPHDEFLLGVGRDDPAGLDLGHPVPHPTRGRRGTTSRAGSSGGDFTAINRDPAAPDNVATFNQYASSPTMWQQFIGVVTDN